MSDSGYTARDAFKKFLEEAKLGERTFDLERLGGITTEIIESYENGEADPEIFPEAVQDALELKFHAEEYMDEKIWDLKMEVYRIVAQDLLKCFQLWED